MLTVRNIESILANVAYQNWIFFVAAKEDTFEPDYLQVKFVAPCSTSGQAQNWSGRKWQLSKWMTTSEIVTTAFKAVLTAIEHEAREGFLYKGQPIFGPHIDVDALAQLYVSQGENVLDVRESVESIEQEKTDGNNTAIQYSNAKAECPA